MDRLYNILSFPRIFFHAVRALRTQRKFIRKSIDPIIKDNQREGLTDVDIKKIRKYYGFAVPAILGEGFCILRGKPMQEAERSTLTYLGASTGLYDDFIDKLNTPESHILALTNHPDEKIAGNIHELLSVKFYKSALDHSPDPELIKQRALEVYKAQLLSKKQKDDSLTEEEISSITQLKGGVSLLFYRSALIGQPDKQEEELLYSLGGLMQLENDIFDIYKDHQDNIATLATTTNKIDDLRNTYQQLYNNTIHLLSKTRFSNSNKLNFLRYINLIIHRGSVCLDCLESNEKLTEGVFTIQAYERKQLICDMEKIGNIFSTFKYYVNSEIAELVRKQADKAGE